MTSPPSGCLLRFSKRRDTRRATFAKSYRPRAPCREQGVGRFSSDRLGKTIILQTKSKNRGSPTHRLMVDWSAFERDDTQHFETVPIEHDQIERFGPPKELKSYAARLVHGTIIEIGELRHYWRREDLRSLKAALAKLINPFGTATDRFSIDITAPAEMEEDNRHQAEAKKSGRELSSRDVINGLVGNFIFSDLQEKTTFVQVEIVHGYINSVLDRPRGGHIQDKGNQTFDDRLDGAGFRCELY